MKTRFSMAILAFFSVCCLRADAQSPRTVAETSDFKETTLYADVVEFCKQLAKESPLVRLGELGASHEGRKLPLIIVADPPIASAEEARKSKKLVVFAIGNIHAGEVDGKEGLLMLARDVALAKERPLLKDLILVFAPDFNADGGEKLGKNRPQQAGPERVGVRANSQGFDLNRDFVKLESPEVRALVKFFNEWDPAIFIDCHTTNGSYHRYTLTYEGGRRPAGDAGVIDFVRYKLFPDVSQTMEKATGYKSYFYGNFNPDRSLWETVSPTPRYSTHYFGLRNRIGILSESYNYASFKDRVLVSKAFVQAICEYTAKHKDEIAKLLADARAATIKAGQAPTEKDRVVLRHKDAAQGRPVNILGFVEEKKDGRRVATDKLREYEVQYMGATEPTLSVPRPYAYLVPGKMTNVIENLKRHGIALEELLEDGKLNVEAYHIDKIERSRAFQKHQQVTLEAKPAMENRLIKKGTVVVRTAQPLGSLAIQLLEPQSSDGLATWNFFDEDIGEGKEFPVTRLLAPAELKITPRADAK